jgi:hypothetical protein
VHVRKYQLGKFVPEPGEDLPIFKEPAQADIPESDWKRRQQEYSSQTPIKLSPPPEMDGAPSGGGLVPLALLAGALFLL